MSPEDFIVFAGAALTLVLGWITAAVVLVKSDAKELPRWAKPLKPLLSIFLGQVPRTPKVRCSSRHNEIRLDWTCGRSSVWNEDMYEVQTDTTDERVKQKLGRDFLRSFWGKDKTYTIGQLPANHRLKFRVRAMNQGGKSPWVEVDHRTTSIPEKSGGKETDYSWNQTNEYVEITVEVPKTTTSKTLEIEVKGGRLRAYCRKNGRELIEGKIYGPVRSSGLVDFVWELETVGGSKLLRVELEKTRPAERKTDLWPKALESGLDFDVHLMHWDRAWDNREEWQHVMRSEEGKFSVNNVSLDDYIAS